MLVAFTALAALCVHGAFYVAHKTEGELNRRARRIAVILWPALLLLTCASLLATLFIQPVVLDNYKAHPVNFLIPIVVFGCLGTMFWAVKIGRDKLAFTTSGFYLAGMLAGAAFALYPSVLPARTEPSDSLTSYNTAAGHHGSSVGLAWWVVGVLLAITYFAFAYRTFRGKVTVMEEDEGY